MKALLADGRVLDWIIAGMVCEGVGLVLLYRLRGRGIPPAALLPNLLAGLCLLLAMRLALSGAWWGFVSAALLAALVFHLAELKRDWR
jgi:Na+-driven multidrug efflux pump